MSWLDVIILLPLLVGLIRGLMRGLVTEFIAILAVILGCVGAHLWGETFSSWMQSQFTWPENICTVVAAVLLFLAIAIVMNLIGKLFTKLLSAIHLGWLNRLSGGLFGTLKWAIIVLFFIFLNDKLDNVFHYMSDDLKKQSVTYEPAVRATHASISFFRSELGK